MNTTKANRRTMAHHHMRRSAFFPGRPGGMITEITWKAGKSGVICEWRIFFNAAFERRELAGIKEGRRDEK